MIQKVIEGIGMEKAVYITRRMLACSRISEVEEILKETTK